MKNFSSKLLRWFSPFALYLIIYGCEEVDPPDYLLRATFENDALDGPPDGTLPAIPIGDELSGYNYGTVVTTPGNPQYKSCDFPSMGFKSKTSNLNGVIIFVWGGHLVNLSNPFNNIDGTETQVRIHDGSGNILVLIQIYHEHVTIKYPNSSLSYTSGRYLGTPFSQFHCCDGNSEHTFIVALNYGKKTFDLTLAGPDLTSSIREKNISIYDPDATIPKGSRPTIQFFSTQRRYIADEVFIYRY